MFTFNVHVTPTLLWLCVSELHVLLPNKATTSFGLYSFILRLFPIHTTHTPISLLTFLLKSYDLWKKHPEKLVISQNDYTIHKSIFFSEPNKNNVWNFKDCNNNSDMNLNGS